MRYGNIGLRVTGSSVTWDGPDEIVRIHLQPNPSDSYPDQKWTLEIRGPSPPLGSFLTAEVMVLNAPLDDAEETPAIPDGLEGAELARWLVDSYDERKGR
jgi:hypothetical protein